jgi:hypothetical protein
LADGLNGIFRTVENEFHVWSVHVPLGGSQGDFWTDPCHVTDGDCDGSFSGGCVTIHLSVFAFRRHDAKGRITEGG